MIIRRRAVVRGRPGVVGTMARTAVVAGTASAVAGSVSNRMNNSAQEAPQVPAQSYAPPPEYPPQTNLTDELQRLSELKAQGALTEEEFVAAKNKLVSG